jgi:hypothetical protein
MFRRNTLSLFLYKKMETVYFRNVGIHVTTSPHSITTEAIFMSISLATSSTVSILIYTRPICRLRISILIPGTENVVKMEGISQNSVGT